ncbi:MAG: hypothetical protein ACLQIQ_00100, partial [Beijerinckiaceae bacterium]
HFFHAENVTGFNVPSNLENSLCCRGFPHSSPANPPTKCRDEPVKLTMKLLFRNGCQRNEKIAIL